MQFKTHPPDLGRAHLPAALISCALVLGGCGPLPLASVAVSALMGGEGSDLERNPMDRPPGESVSDPLSRAPDSTDHACLAALDDKKQASLVSAAAPRPHVLPPRPTETANATPAVSTPLPSAPIPREGNACRLEWTCLPGFTEPTRMMVCPTGDTVERTLARQPSAPDFGHTGQ